MTPEERAKSVLHPLFNPEPHPLQVDWSDEHSMSLSGLTEKLAEAIRLAEDAARLQAFKEAARIAEALPYVEYQAGGRAPSRESVANILSQVAAAIRAKGEGK